MKWIKLFLLICIILILTGCFGPGLFNIFGFKVTAGTVATVPAKVEAYDKYKKEKEMKENEME